MFLFSPAKTFPELSLWKCQRRDSLILCRTNSQKCFPQPTTWKCHWSNRDRTKNQKPTVPWLSLTIDGNVTGQKILHHPWLFIKFSYIKLNTRKEILASQKKKMEKVRLSTQTHRNDWLLGLIFLSRHTLSLPYNHNLSHRHIGRVICVGTSRQIRPCWITADSHTIPQQHEECCVLSANYGNSKRFLLNLQPVMLRWIYTK